jgi:Protein of unknown function (DUF2510)
VSDTTASGAAGSAAPGWYTDPQDPNQLRWWSGEGWTEHVSGGAAAPEQAVAEQVVPEQVVPEQVVPEQVAAQQVALDGATAEPAVAQPVIPEQLATEPAAAEPVVPEAASAEPSAAPQSLVQPGDALPSRRALRDPAVEANDASAAAEAALLAQQQQRAAEEAQTVEPAQPAAQAPEAPQQAAPAPAQPSAPVPTLPVQPTTFLEQAGYPPLDAGPSQPQAAVPEAAVPEAAVPEAAVPEAVAPQAPEAALPQPVSAQPEAPQPFVPPQPPRPFVPPQAAQPVQPLQANAWDQAAEEAGPYASLTPTQNLWNQPVSADTQLPPVQPVAGTVSTEAAAGGAVGALVVGSAAVQAQDPAWALSPNGQAPEQASRRRGADAAVSQTARSSTFWSWLIAISPILAAGAIGYVLASTGYVLSGWPIEAAVAAPYLLVLLFALADRAALVSLGHSQPRSAAWALLTAPVYLIVRASETRREDGTGTGLTLIWFVSFLVAIGGFVGYGFLIHHALIAGLPS